VEKPWTASKNSKNGTVHSFLHRAWKTGERMPVFHKRQQASGAPSRAAPSVFLFTTNGTYNRQTSDAGNTINPSTKSGQAQLVKL
jgi:hypothetical protein